MTSTALKIMCAGLVLLLAGCGDQKPQQKLVAFSQANNAEPYRATQKALMEKLFAGSPDTKLVVSDAQQDNSKQIAQIETFIRQKPSVLIVAPNERAALTAVMGKAMQAGIPVICLERDILEPNYTTYIRMDNKAIGRLAGQFIVDQLTRKYGTPKGNVVMLRGLLGVEAE
ncbi:MAG: substrate-binding domain-containing protein, partial [Rhizomicrobium sp.]